MSLETTRAKASTVALCLPVFPVSVFPDGSGLAQLERQAAGWGYAGILAGAAAVVIGIAHVFIDSRQNRRLKTRFHHTGETFI